MLAQRLLCMHACTGHTMTTEGRPLLKSRPELRGDHGAVGDPPARAFAREQGGSLGTCPGALLNEG